MMEQYKRDEQRIHRIVYYLVWGTKRNKPLLTSEVAAECRRLIEHVCLERGWHILEPGLEIQPSQVKLKIQVWPSVAAEEVVQTCKFVTVHGLRQKVPDLAKKLPSFWTRAYLASVYEPSPQDLELFQRMQNAN